MGRAVEVGTGYLTLAVETSGVAAGVGQQFARIQGIGASAGKKTGQAFAKGFDQASPSNIEDLTKKAQVAQEKLAASAQRSSKIRADAARKVQIEELKLNELRESGKAKASQLATAEDRVKAARSKYIDVSRKGIGDLRSYQQAMDKSNRELREAKSAADGATRSADKAHGVFGRLGQRLKGAFSGSNRGAFKGFETEAQRSTDKIENEFEKSGRESGKRFGGAMKGLVVAAVAGLGLRELTSGIGDAVQSAGQLEQSVGAIGSVFKENQGQMIEWSNQAATSVGLSKNEYNELGTLIGAQLKNAGTAMEDLAPKTDELIGLGADLASMFGGTTSDAVAALSSALKGERDPIEKYGVTLTAASVEAEAAALGFEKVDDQLTQEAKSAATVSLIMKQTTDSHGNFAKEADTFAGKQQRMVAQWEDLKAKIGEVFMPVFSSAVSFMSDKALPAFTDIAGGIRAFREAWIANDGDITSSGFAGYMEELAYKLRGFYEETIKVTAWLKETSSQWGPFAAGIGLVIGAYKLWTAAVIIHEKALLAQAAAFIIANAPIVAIIAAIGLMIGALIYAYKHHEGFRDLVNKVWAKIKQVVSAVVDWVVNTAFPWVQEALRKLGDWFGWLYEDVIKPTWSAVRAAMSAVVGWVVNTAFPWVQDALQTLGAAFRWLNERVIQPVWTAIRVYIAVVVGVLLTLWDGLVWAFHNILAPAFRWFYDRVVKPVWDRVSERIRQFTEWWTGKAWPAIRDGINWVSDKFVWFYDKIIKPVWDRVSEKIAVFLNWYVNIFGPAVRRGVQWVADKFVWFHDKVIKPVWDKISGKIGDAWSFIRDKALTPMMDWVENKVVKAFERAKDGIGEQWGKLKGLVREPVDFFVNTVYNQGLRPNINTILTKVGLGEGAGKKDKRLPEMKMPKGFATGGIVPGFQPRKKDDYLVPLRGGEGILVPEAVRAMGPEAIHTINTAANRGGVAGAQEAIRHETPALGSRVYEGQASFSNVYQQLLQRTRQTGVGTKGYVNPVWGVDWATNAWNGLAGIELKRTNAPGLRMDLQEVGGGTFNHPNWAGMYTGINDIFVNRDSRASLNPAQARAVTAHEIGHALGLPHSNSSRSLMNPTIGRGTLYPTAYDALALRQIYPGPAKGTPIDFSKIPTGPGGPEDDRRWFDGLNPIKKLIDAAFERITSKFGDALVPQLVAGLAKYLGRGFVEGITPQLMDSGGKLEPGLSLIKNETGTTEAILTAPQWDTMTRIAENSEDGGGVHFHGNITTQDPEELFREADRRERIKRTLRR